MQFKTEWRHVPEGWEQGLPRVTVSDATVRFLGKPTVNYALLEEFFREGFDLPEGLTPTVRIYGGPHYRTHRLVRGAYPPFSTMIAVNAPRAVAKYGPNGTMRGVARFTQGMLDHYTRLSRLAYETGQRAMFTKTGKLALFGCAEIVTPQIAPYLIAAATPALAYAYRKNISPAQRRRRAAGHNNELFERYGTAITFDSDVAASLQRDSADDMEALEEDMV